MDIRVLQYFLTVAREQSITRAAEVLHMTQPPLSRQLKDLEDELGKQLLIRGSRKITLTEEGTILCRRAEEILQLVEHTKAEITSSDENISGDIYIGGGETKGFSIISNIFKKLRENYPNIHCHIYSGNSEDVCEKLDSGLLDFGILIEPADIQKYDFIKLPTYDRWGLLMRKDSFLAEKESISPNDLNNLPIIASRQSIAHNELSGWLGMEYESLNIVATYNLLYNASLMVEAGVGYALCLDNIIPKHEKSPLIFKPLEPEILVGLVIVWKKYKSFSKPAEAFINTLMEKI